MESGALSSGGHGQGNRKRSIKQYGAIQEDILQLPICYGMDLLKLLSDHLQQIYSRPEPVQLALSHHADYDSHGFLFRACFPHHSSVQVGGAG